MEEVIRLVERGKAELEAHSSQMATAHAEAAALGSTDDRVDPISMHSSFLSPAAAPPTPPADPELGHELAGPGTTFAESDNEVPLREEDVNFQAEDDVMQHEPASLDASVQIEPPVETSQRRDIDPGSGASDSMDLEDGSGSSQYSNADQVAWDEDVAR